MFAIIEQKNFLLNLQRMDDGCERIRARHTDTERRSNDRRHELRVVDCGKVYEGRTACALACPCMGRCYRHRRLADAAGPHDRYEPQRFQIASNEVDLIRPSKDARCPGWQAIAAPRS
jgi:hypothetical protein